MLLSRPLKNGKSTLINAISAGYVSEATGLPSAIRRVQVELPVKNLRESGSVLVDTPGLYSKIKCR